MMILCCTAKYFELFPAMSGCNTSQNTARYLKKSKESVIKMLLFTGNILTVMVNLMAMNDMLVAKKAYQ